MTTPATASAAPSGFESRLAAEVARRRTLAIISHPDAGKTTVGAEVIPDGGHGKPATIKLTIGGKPAGEGRVPMVLFAWSIEPFQVGRDDISPISPDYHGKGGFPFNRGIEEVKFDLVK